MASLKVGKILQNPSLVTIVKKGMVPRPLSTQANPAEKIKDETKKEKSLDTNSFVMSIFSGQVKVNQVFPFPDVLSSDQIETLNMLREPSSKFFSEVNNAMENDAKETVDPNTLQVYFLYSYVYFENSSFFILLLSNLLADDERYGMFWYYGTN